VGVFTAGSAFNSIPSAACPNLSQIFVPAIASRSMSEKPNTLVG
jgi:hypothetical protein